MAVCVGLLFGCKVEVTTDANPEAAFDRYTTFEMCVSPEEESVPGIYNTMENREAIEKNIIISMQKRGFNLVNEGADVLVNYHISSSQESHLITNCTHDEEDGFWPSCRIEEFVFTKGTLTIHMVDNETGAVVWIGTAEGVLDGVEEEDVLELIEEVVEKIYEKYPKYPTTI